MQTPPATELPDRRADYILAAIAAVVAAVLVWQTAGRIPVQILGGRNPDIYFSSDTARVHSNMHSRDSNHWRTSVHPIFSILLHPTYQVTARATGAELGGGELSPDAIRVGRQLSAAAAGIAAALFFALLRQWRVRRGDALVLTALFSASAFFVFWFSIPETYPWGAISILGALLLAGRKPEAPGYTPGLVVANIASLAITTTNWMAGLGATLVRVRWLRTAKIAVAALVITLGLAVAQKLIYPSSHLFVRPFAEKSYVMKAESGGPLRCWTSIFVHTVVAPEAALAPHSRIKGQSVVSAQRATPGSSGAIEVAAICAWGLLLAACVYALFARAIEPELRLTLGLLLAGQVGLHTVYGAETFLYAAHYGPLFLAGVGLATRTKLRIPVLIVAALLTGLLLRHNFREFDDLIQLLEKAIALNAASGAVPN
jgi:hypothetical protein